MSTGARSQPPDLPNFEYRSWLGGGGFADVFLYDQLRPQRQVAVKVLRTGSLDAADLRAFDAEANLMAKVSAHPYIVSIYGADVAPDGRPFLVMEYYAKPNFGQRSRGSGLPVQEVLRVGVRVASAVETAHRAGILHRDIKPANILVNDYDRPGLTDFGIAGDREGSGLAEAQGVTVAYAPPEVLASDNVQGEEAGDVYSLAATLYALLVGRAPFEVPGGDNSAQALLQRTLNSTVPGIGRPDVPRTLELLLSQAMARDATHRPSSAAALGRALQGIERELSLAPTDFELAGGEVIAPAPAGPDDDADSTRAGRIQVVRPIAEDVARTPISEVPAGHTQARGTAARSTASAAAEPVTATPSETVARPRPVGSTAGDPAEAIDDSSTEGASPDRRRLIAMLAGGIVVVGVVTGVLLSQAGGGGTSASTTTVGIGENELVVEERPAEPANVTVTRTGDQVTVSWEPGDGPGADSFTVRRTDRSDDELAAQRFETSPVVVDGIADDERPCFTVMANNSGAQSSNAVEACAP